MYLLKQNRRFFSDKYFWVFPICVVWTPRLMDYRVPTSELTIHFLCWHWQWQFRKGRKPKVESPAQNDWRM